MPPPLTAPVAMEKVPGHMMPTEKPHSAMPSRPITGELESEIIR